MHHARLFALTVVASLASGCRAGPPNAGEQIAAWTLQPLFTIGAEGDSVELQRVRSVLWTRDARLLVADVAARRILSFDSTGRLLGFVGRDGSGPAEYRFPASKALLGDTVAVLDQGNARIGLFTPTGAWAGSFPSPRISGPEIRLFRVPGAEFYAFGMKSAADGRSQLAYVRHNARGAGDTLTREQPKVPVDAA